MTLDEAIDTLHALSKGKYEGSRADARVAERLGSEALKRFKEARSCSIAFAYKSLPSETRE